MMIQTATKRAMKSIFAMSSAATSFTFTRISRATHVSAGGPISTPYRTFITPSRVAQAMALPTAPGDNIINSPALEAASPTSADMTGSILESNSETDWITNPSKESFLDVATKAFSGSERTDPEPGFEWAFRGVVPTEFNQERRDLYRFILDLTVSENIDKGGIIFGHPATGMAADRKGTDMKTSETDEGEAPNNDDLEMASGIMLYDFDPAVEFKPISMLQSVGEDMNMAWTIGSAAMSGSLPGPLYSLGNLGALVSRAPMLKEIATQAHTAYGPQEPHLYVQVVAMDPDFQGLGFGKQLMNQVNEIADRMGKAAYLECAGERNPIFYQKFGYRIVHESVIESPDGDGDVPPLTVYHMTREATTN